MLWLISCHCWLCRYYPVCWGMPPLIFLMGAELLPPISKLVSKYERWDTRSSEALPRPRQASCTKPAPPPRPALRAAMNSLAVRPPLTHYWYCLWHDCTLGADPRAVYGVGPAGPGSHTARKRSSALDHYIVISSTYRVFWNCSTLCTGRGKVPALHCTEQYTRPAALQRSISPTFSSASSTTCSCTSGSAAAPGLCCACECMRTHNAANSATQVPALQPRYLVRMSRCHGTPT